jgi:hypothetical protein
MGLICALFWDVTQSRLVISVVSRQLLVPSAGAKESNIHPVCSHSSYVFLSIPGLLHLLGGAGNFGKVSSVCGQREVHNAG